jgi:hypothetical protein
VFVLFIGGERNLAVVKLAVGHISLGEHRLAGGFAGQIPFSANKENKHSECCMVFVKEESD